MRLANTLTFLVLLALVGMRLSTSTTAQEPKPTAAATPPSQSIQFNRDIRPILSDKCYTCHGPDKTHRRTAFHFDDEVSSKQELPNGHTAIVPGNLEKSALIQRITAEDARVRMPPAATGQTLSEKEIALLKAWVEQGAKWEKHWAFIPPTRPTVPTVQEPSWVVRNPIDAFVLQKLAQAGLAPSPEADRETLLRRVTLDLIGKGPTLAELDAFLADRSPTAYEKVVDRLLRSPQYGERMALPWLDAARYSDTSGYFVDYNRSMWRWRDWVIAAFNRNVPYDQFTIEQLAGDLLPTPTLDQRIATAFNRNHRTNVEAGAIAAEYAVEYPADRAATTSSVFLGLTFGTCARCHDHKYDPFTQKEFYQFFAYFNNVPELGTGDRGNARPRIKAPTPVQQVELKQMDDRMTAASARLAKLESSIAAAEARWLTSIQAGSARQWAPTRGLIAHYPLDGSLQGTVKPPKPKPAGRGGTAQADQNQVNAAANPEQNNAPPEAEWKGHAEFTTGIIGEAARFDGSSFIDAGNVGDFGNDFSSEVGDRFSLSAWIYPTSGTGVILSRTQDLPQEKGYILELKDDGKVQLTYAGNSGDHNKIRMVTDAPIALNRWHQVTVTCDGTALAPGLKLYVDGQLQVMQVAIDFLTLNPSVRDPLRIGGGGGPDYRFRGLIDDVRIYDTELTPEEVGILAVSKSLNELARRAPAERTKAETDKIRLAFLADAAAPVDGRAAFQQLIKLREDRLTFLDIVPSVSVMEEMPTPRATHVLIRGAYDQPGEIVTPNVPAILPPFPNGYPPNRLGLARWLVNGANPLTARVAVNRFWQMYFGTGIVKTLEDFGSQGEAPSHPELLDWLATEFVGTAWNMKALQKTIVMSATYRQASRATPALRERDPENRLLARGPRIRLPAEMVRDQALSMSGLLVEKLGGRSVMPYQPPGVYSERGGGTDPYVPDHGENLYRRSLYTYWKRTIPPPSMANFDAPTRESCLLRRDVTNTPLQALDLMNNVTYLEAARLLAERMLNEGGGSPQQRITFAFRLATGRRPTEREMGVLVNALRYEQERFRERPDAAADYVNQGEHSRDQSLDVKELAAHATVASLIMNLDKTITKE